MADEREVRCLMSGVELRAPSGGKGPGMVTGYAAVFNRFSEGIAYFREKIAPGAFSEAIVKDDVRALVNHDPNQLIGRNTSKTLRLAEDYFGLKVEIDLPDTGVGRDTAESIRAGNMDGMSFAFTTDVDEWDYSGDVPVRTLVKVKQLYDVGPVTYPAYLDTSAAMRSLDRSKPVPESVPVEFDPLPLYLARTRLRFVEALSP
jgi:HK97 family phage prohead protease